jgi:hypothetical protein
MTRFVIVDGGFYGADPIFGTDELLSLKHKTHDPVDNG